MLRSTRLDCIHQTQQDLISAVALPPDISVILLAYGAEPHLQEVVSEVLGSVDPALEPLNLELILVDNGAAPAVAQIPPDPRMQRLHPPRNLGFAGGCNLAAGHARGQWLVFLNSDAVVAADAVAALVRPLLDGQVGLATGSVRLADRPNIMNTAGNPVHFTGVAWAGGLGEDSDRHILPRQVTSVSGAFFAISRANWLDLGGFDESYFAYHEDVDLSLRAWQHGLRIQYVPDAVALHHYEFSRNPAKQFLLERNRLTTVLTVFPRRLLLAVLPALVGMEAAVNIEALTNGWLGAKWRGYWWLVRHARYIVKRRVVVQRANRLSPATFGSLLVDQISPTGVDLPAYANLANDALQLYWRAARRAFGIG